MEHPADKHSIVSELTHCCETLDKDDLCLLAKMHDASEALIGAIGIGAAPPDGTVCELAASLSQALETVILRACDDLDGAVDGIVDEVGKIADLCGLPLPTRPDLPGVSDVDISAKLAAVFDDEPEAVTPGDEDANPPYVQEPLVIAEGEAEFVQAFLEEAFEHIEAIEAAVLDVEHAPDDTSKIDDLFRPFHTIKGGAGFLNLRDVGSLTHEVETLLDQSRKGERTITSGLIDLVFDVVDILKAQLGAVREYTANPTGQSIPQPPISDMIRHLRDVVANRVSPDGRPTDGSSGGKRIGDRLVDKGAVAREVVDFAVEKQRTGRTAKKTGEILLDTKVASARQVNQAMRDQTAQANPRATQGDQSIRIDTAKLDALIDMVGELVIAQTQVSTHPQIHDNLALLKNVSQADKIVRDVQELAMGMRMIPVRGSFQKMSRLVRDVSHKAGKQVELVISGEETELDKNVIEQIGDPLVHMIRNAVDHGIEPPEVRVAAGKPPEGVIHLSAFHHGGNIVIKIQDDGHGLNPEKLLAKGIEKGIVRPDEELSEQQIFQLVFAPGFSTAAQVTDISGRGVGMDVVKRNLEQLRGRVDIQSELGKGSTFSIRLPLTLAIIDGMVVRIGSERFILQTIAVEQAMRPTPEQITTVQRKGEVLNVRGSLVPLIQLGALFGLTGRIDPCEAMVVLAQCESGTVGLVVEELIGQQQVVIKSLGERFEKLRGISGGAVLGDGRVGLILDIDGIENAHNTVLLKGTPQNRSKAQVEAAELAVEDNAILEKAGSCA